MTIRRLFFSLFLLCLALSAEGQNQPIRIMPLGDSITFGSSVPGGYRNRLYQLLTTAGYNIDFVGLQTGNGVATLPDSDHQGIGGWRIDQVDSDVSKWFGVVANPDVILLHIGTNDFGQNFDTPNAINRFDALITKLATLLPNAHLIVTNLMLRGEPQNTTIQAQFNPYVQARVDAQAAMGRHVTFLDMRAAVPLSDMPDQLHPGQAGYDKMANAWFPAIQDVLTDGPPEISRAVGSADRQHVAITFNKPVADSASSLQNYAIDGGLTLSAASLDATKRVVTLTTSPQTIAVKYTITVNGISDLTTPDPQPIAPNSTVSFYPFRPRGYLANVPESAGYTLACSLEVTPFADFKTAAVPYAVDNRNGIGPFTRVAYYWELQKPGGDLQYLWTSMDAFTTDAKKIGVPTTASSAFFQQNVTGLSVVSNVPGMPAGTGLTGNLEFWPTSSSPANAVNVPGASATTYDFGDTSVAGSYGVMQLHLPAAGQTLFSFNNWGGTASAGEVDLGFGNNPAPTNGGVDWTFAHNGSGYTIRSLQVLVQTTSDVTPPTVAAAVASYGRSQITVTFSEPLAPGSIDASNFTLSNGAIVLGATLSANQRDVILTTTTLPPSGFGPSFPQAPAYVMATFHNNRQRLQIGTSDDGKDWQMLSNAAGSYDLYAPPGGDDLRDPSIVRIGDTWYCAYTSGDYGSAQVPPTSNHFGNSEAYFGLAKSTDLKTWSWVANVPIASTTQVWGPRIFTTADGTVYVVVSVNGTIKYLTATNASLTAWTAATPIPGLPVQARGYPIGPEIFISQAHGGWYLTCVYEHVAGEGTIVTFLKSTTSPVAGYSVINTTNVTGLGRNEVEGPAPVYLGGTRWRLYYCGVETVNGLAERPTRYMESEDDLATWTTSELATHDAVGDIITHPHVLLFPPLTVTVTGVRDTSPSANRLASTASVAITASSLPAEIVANAGAAANGYQLVASLNIPTTGNFNASSSAYTFDERSATGYFSRVAYYLELQKPGGPVEFVWTSMDAFTSSRSKIAVPTSLSGAIFQQNVANLDVVSNVAGIVNGTGISTGNIEFWPTNYSQPSVPTVPGASDSLYDFGDTRSTGGTYGCMQVHNHGAKQTLFALNNWGADGNTLDLGIGNNSGSDWTFANNAGSYSRRVLHMLVLPATPPIPPAVAANVPASAGYQLVYSLNIPANGNATTLPYSVDNSANVGSFSRVAYYLELQTGTAAPKFVWTSMDAFATNAAKLGVPTVASGGFFQQNVTNLDVASNVAGIVNGSTATGGNIEFWSGNYAAANDRGVPNADPNTFDFGDGGASAGAGYGSMQVHNHDLGAKQTLFAFNHFGATSGTLGFCLGIGNNPTAGSAGQGGTQQADWTFTENSATYSNRVLHVFVLPGNSDTTGPVIVSAKPSPKLNRLVVTFNEPLADTAAQAANFAISGGVTVTGAALLPGQKEIALTTTAQSPGTTYTLAATGVRDRSPGGNLILAGASTTFTAFTPPPVLTNVPEAAGYDLIHQLAIPNAASFNTTAVPYAIDETKFPRLQPFDRVAYLLELQVTGNAATWVYVSADTFTNQLGQIGVPAAAAGNGFQQRLTNMNVLASAGAGITTGTALTTGNLEFWPGDYSAPNALAIPNASASNFDFGDTRSTGGGYGSMQIHNHGASQTLFAFNNWGGNGGNNDLGIGNDPAPMNLGVDWTFHHNAAGYSVKNLYVLARAGGTPSGTAPLLLSHPTSRLVAPDGSTAFAVSVHGAGPFYFQWRLNGTPIAGASNPWLDLVNISSAQLGTYDVVVTAAGGASTTSQHASLGFINRAPTFSGYSFTAQRGVATTISRESLLARASDADGDLLEIADVTATSQQGGAISLGANVLSYTPAPGFAGADQFTATIIDQRGGNVTATMTANVFTASIAGSQSSAVARRADGKVEAIFRGLPRTIYLIERSPDLVEWETMQTLTAGDDGLIPMLDSAPPTDQAFYRARLP